MRVAIISDMHGNDIAFEAALNSLQGRYDQMVCLGDCIQGGPQPAQVVQRLRNLNVPVVMGNADAWLITGVETGNEGPATPKMEAVRQWSLSQLSADDIEFIRSFRPTVEIELGNGKDLLCFHGSPYSFDDIILPDTPEDEVQKYLGEFKSSFLTGGHTHLQQVRRMGENFFFNPGSVGLAYDHHQPEGTFKNDHWAEYAVL